VPGEVKAGVNLRSRYIQTCVCGKRIESEQASGSCGACGRLFEIRWGEQDPERLRLMAAAAARKASKMKALLTLALAAGALLAQPVPSLPQHVVDVTSGELILKADPEYNPHRFRCLRPVDNMSCTALAPRTMDGKPAYGIIRKLVEKVVKDSGVGEYTIWVEFSEIMGFDGGWRFVVKTPRGEGAINALWPALWLSLRGETDASVRGRIAEALEGVL
jgi:hypothetical protein